MKTRLSVARCCCPRPGEQPTTIVVDIESVNLYDEEQLVAAAGGAGLDNQDIGPPNLFYRCNATWRFVNVAIPNGANITEAKIIAGSGGLQVSRQGSTTPPDDASAFVRLRWSAEDSDDAPVYTTPADYETRARTATFTDTADFWASFPGNAIDEVDVTSSIQSIANRAGWVSGNALALIADENGSDQAKEGNPGAGSWCVMLGGLSCVQLEITYA